MADSDRLLAGQSFLWLTYLYVGDLDGLLSQYVVYGALKFLKPHDISYSTLINSGISKRCFVTITFLKSKESFIPVEPPLARVTTSTKRVWCDR